MHRLVEHVGEVELELGGPSEVDIFVQAATTFRKLVFLAEVERFVPLRVASLKLESRRLRAAVEGVQGRPCHLVKGATLHGLRLIQVEEGWRGHLVLDV